MEYVYILATKLGYEARRIGDVDLFREDVRVAKSRREKVVRTFIVSDESKANQIHELVCGFVDEHNLGRKPKLKDLESTVAQLVGQSNERSGDN